MTTNDDSWLMLHDMYCAVNSDGLPVEGKAEVLAGYFKLYGGSQTIPRGILTGRPHHIGHGSAG